MTYLCAIMTCIMKIIQSKVNKTSDKRQAIAKKLNNDIHTFYPFFVTLKTKTMAPQSILEIIR